MPIKDTITPAAPAPADLPQSSPCAESDAICAARWRFMMIVADNEGGPEDSALERHGRGSFVVDRPESSQLCEMVDAAMAEIAAGAQP